MVWVTNQDDNNAKLGYWFFYSQLIINQLLSFQLWRYLIALVSDFQPPLSIIFSSGIFLSNRSSAPEFNYQFADAAAYTAWVSLSLLLSRLLIDSSGCPASLLARSNMAFSVYWIRISLTVHSASSLEMSTLSIEDCGSKSALNAATVWLNRDCSLASCQRLAVRPWVT